jgi:hypothetical protein
MNRAVYESFIELKKRNPKASKEDFVFDIKSQGCGSPLPSRKQTSSTTDGTITAIRSAPA